MTIRRFDLADKLDVFDRFFSTVPFSTPSYAFARGSLYNPDTHELVIKDSYIDDEVKRLEDEEEDVRRNMKSSEEYYKNRLKLLGDKKEQLKQRKKENKRLSG